MTNMNPPPLIELRQIRVTFGQKPVLEDVSFHINPKEIVTVLGPNGAGKSTLARVVLGLTRSNGGELIRKPGLRIGYVPQKFHVDSSFPITVNRFLRMAPHADDRAKALASTGVQHLATAQLHDLSGGEMQRVLLARALLQKPELLVLDEPAQGVDVAGQAEMYQLIRRTRDQYQCAALVISHDLHLVMAATDQVLCLNRHLCCAGHPEKVANHPSFRAMFGSQAAESLAIYHHHHDHHHHADGSVGAGKECTAHHV